VLSHRLVLRAEARLRGETPDAVVARVLDSIPVPVEDELVG
jgi:hypothetical protein